jgi:hypothetical protein
MNKEEERNRRMFNQLQNRIAQAPNGFSSPQFQAGGMENPYKNNWPYWYSFTNVRVGPSSTENIFVTVTQEAAFTWLTLEVTVYEVFGAPGAETLIAIDRNVPDIASGEANPLKIALRDPQAQRYFHSGNMPIDAYGYGVWPTQLPRGILFMPNSQIQCVVSNTDTSRKFIPQITMNGYRIRVDLQGNPIQN